MSDFQTVELSFRVDDDVDAKLLEQIQAYNAFLSAAEMAGPYGRWLSRLT